MVDRFDDYWNMYDLYSAVFLTAGCFSFTLNFHHYGEGEADWWLMRQTLNGEKVGLCEVEQRSKVKKPNTYTGCIKTMENTTQSDIKIANPSPFFISEL